MRHRGWLELLKNYELTISYHHGKANVEADVLSRKFFSSGSDDHILEAYLGQFEENGASSSV